MSKTNIYVVTYTEQGQIRETRVEADYYSVSTSGSSAVAHFFLNGNNSRPIASFLTVRTVTLKYEIKDEGFPPDMITGFELGGEPEAALRKDIANSLRERKPLVYGRDWYFMPVTVPATAASKIREEEGLPMATDPVSFLARVIEEQRRATETLKKIEERAKALAEEATVLDEKRTKRISIRYVDATGTVVKHGTVIDLDNLPPEICIDLRRQTGYTGEL